MSRQRYIPVILTSRDLRIFLALVTTRFLGTTEIMTVAGFTSLRRANRRLLKLVRAGFLRRWFVPTQCGGRRALYGLSVRSAREIGEPTGSLLHWKQDALITSNQTIAHQEAINRVFIEVSLKPPPEGLTCARWLSFKTALSPTVRLVPDGYFEIVQHGKIHPMFIDVDRGTETSAVWLRKTEHYLRLAISGDFERLFQQKAFRVLAIFPSERRLAAIRRTIAKRTAKLFWFTTESESLWSNSWRRPTAERAVGLFGVD